MLVSQFFVPLVLGPKAGTVGRLDFGLGGNCGLWIVGMFGVRQISGVTGS